MDQRTQTALIALAVALLLDRFFGEYPAPLHPVVWMGTVVKVLLQAAPRGGWWRPFLFGVVLAIGVPALFTAAAWAALRWAAQVRGLDIAIAAFLLKASFSLRELGAAAERVRSAVEAGDLPRAREELRSLCSRDSAQLDEEALLTGTVQSLAENLSDSFVAPLFYFALFGVPGAIAYRAINTLDAMIGYRGPYEALGKASARLDDVANWIPARVTTLFLLLAGSLTGKDVAGGWRILRRDSAKTPSPNGGRPMAAMAGLLGVQLEKQGVYALGDRQQPVTTDTVRDAWRLVVVAGWITAFLCLLATQAHGLSQSVGY